MFYKFLLDLTITDRLSALFATHPCLLSHLFQANSANTEKQSTLNLWFYLICSEK